MDNNATSGEILSFIALLEKHKIEIPIIQRDYAQGRSENEDIRLDFLHALKTSILEERNIKLDFIYGEIVDDVFQPLDGQQRLTTLFLLHWYAMTREGSVPDEGAVRLLSKFTYETRLSSRYFCNYLIEKSIELKENTKISDVIRDANWFYLSWEQDPSIKAMLNTLDDIKDNFDDVPDLWERLIGQKLITFHYLNLQDLGLSDDLYIKMNARGKLLTPFENFKAQIQMRIEDEKWENGYAITDKFDYKIDTAWTELFWSKFGNRIDSAHIKFISAIVMYKIALNREKNPNVSVRHNILRRLNDNSDGKYLLQFIDKSVYEYIYGCYEIFTAIEKNNVDLDISNIKLWTHSCTESVLKEIATDSSYTKKALMFAQIEFLRRNETFNREAYIKWMRIIRNFVCYANITIKSSSSREDLLRSPEAFESMIGLINTMADGCTNIYNFLENYTIRPNSYRSVQMAEEVEKAKKIKENEQLKDIIWELEDLNVFRGRISFAFDCASAMLFDETVSEEERLHKIFFVFSDYFDDDKNFSPNLFNRAMLTINVDAEYKYYDYWASRWYAINAEKRKFIVNLIELNYFIYNERTDSKKYFLNLILQLLDKNYQNMIDEFIAPSDMPEWKAKLIKEPIMIEERPSDFFAITDDNKQCYLLKSQRPLNTDGSRLIE
ncbi:MAG: DUF262 domain-containing protein [Defluviitaleaceae bacterium]|nr:DUF262 domain-containing protein [Defluviitaleaceae bacterium]